MLTAQQLFWQDQVALHLQTTAPATGAQTEIGWGGSAVLHAIFSSTH